MAQNLPFILNAIYFFVKLSFLGSNSTNNKIFFMIEVSMRKKKEMKTGNGCRGKDVEESMAWNGWTSLSGATMASRARMAKKIAQN